MSEPTEQDQTRTSAAGGGSLEDLIPIEHTADPHGAPARDAALTDIDRLLLFRMGLAEFSMRVERIVDSDWSRPTPASEWSIADLVKHLIEEHRWAPPLLAGAELAAAADDVAEIEDGEDLIGAWLQAAQASSAAFGEGERLRGQVSLSRGSTAVTDYISEMTSDLAIHTWDLGRAQGEAVQLPDSLVGPVLERWRERGDETGGALFAAPVAASPDAPLTDQLIALSGRDPYWSAPTR